MKVEELLGHGKFKNEFHRLRVNLLYSANWLTNEIYKFLEPYDLTQQQFNILRILRGEHPEKLSTLQLRNRMIISKSDTSRLVDRLQLKGLVDKKPCGKDKRLVDVSISEEGLSLLDKIDERIDNLDSLFNINCNEAKSINVLLNKMRKDTMSTSLENQLKEYKTKFQEKAAANVQEDYEKGIVDLFESDILSNAKNVGDNSIDFELRNASRQTVKLSEYYKNGPVVLTWYRGGWCPYCNLTLKALQNNLPEIKKHGASLIALTPETPDKSLSTKEKNALEFEVLTDTHNEVARKYGLVFRVPDYINAHYKNNFDISEYNGDDSQELPLAATYVINKKGVIKYAFLSADYRERAEPSEIIDALKGL